VATCPQAHRISLKPKKQREIGEGDIGGKKKTPKKKGLIRGFVAPVSGQQGQRKKKKGKNQCPQGKKKGHNVFSPITLKWGTHLEKRKTPPGDKGPASQSGGSQGDWGEG